MARTHSFRNTPTIGTENARGDHNSVELFEEDMKNIGEHNSGLLWHLSMHRRWDYPLDQGTQGEHRRIGYG